MDFHAVTMACKAAMKKAKQMPGRYGGRYVARNNAGIVRVLTHDDPDLLGEEWDVIAHCTPDKVLPIGHARNWLNDDGSVTFATTDA
ncbi:MAG: hypothetical protein ACYTG0_45205 [Planctomycetota bacterium]|jgi:hypothetical protein